jgi:cysteine desulfurase/selenocysteine lyase
MTAERWESLRAQFPVVERLAYFDHAAVSPLPLRASEHIGRYLDELTRYGASNYPGEPFATLSRARALGAQLIGTRPEQVFIVRSTTQGLGIAATGLPVRPGDNVVLVEREFPANIRPWLPLRRRGVEVRFVPQRRGRVLLDDLAARVDDRTRAVSVSHVQFLSGFRIDVGAVAEICRRHDALFVLDAIQGLGAFPLDVEAQGVDFLAADAHKWLLGPEGVGLGYAAPRAVERIEPALEGWLAVRDPFDFFDVEQPLKETAERYEEGAYNLAGIHGMVGSLELILEAGVGAIMERVLQLTDIVVDRLAARGWELLSPREVPAERSGIVLAAHAGVDFTTLRGRLRERGIVVSVRGGAMRVAPHAYNTAAEIDRLLAELP